jgi:hypothetical protein
MITTFGQAANSALADPILWVFLAVAAVLGAVGVKWPWAVVVAMVAAILDSAINTYSRATAGLPFSPVTAVFSFGAVVLAYSAASAIRRASRR